MQMSAPFSAGKPASAVCSQARRQREAVNYSKEVIWKSYFLKYLFTLAIYTSSPIYSHAVKHKHNKSAYNDQEN